MQIDCRAVNKQQIPQEARGKAHEPKKEHKCQLSSHHTATTQKIQKVKRGVCQYKIQPLEVHVW